MALVMQHDQEGIGALLVKHGVASIRAGDVDAGFPLRRDGWRDDLDLLAAEQPALARVRIEPADKDARRCSAVGWVKSPARTLELTQMSCAILPTRTGLTVRQRGQNRAPTCANHIRRVWRFSPPYGAVSTPWHAGGRFAMVSGGFGFSGVGDGLGCSTASVNHQSRSLPQPSPGGGGGCGLHSGLSAGQRRRTWK